MLYEVQQSPRSARRNNFPGEQISWRFLLLSGNLSASNYPGPAYCDLTKQESTVTHKGAKQFYVEHLIATITDPKDSRLDYLFDRHLDAIQRAIEAPEGPTVAGSPSYVLDRSWLPWERQQ